MWNMRHLFQYEGLGKFNKTLELLFLEKKLKIVSLHKAINKTSNYGR